MDAGDDNSAGQAKSRDPMALSRYLGKADFTEITGHKDMSRKWGRSTDCIARKSRKYGSMEPMQYMHIRLG